VWYRFLSVGFGRDHGCSTALGDHASDVVAVIASVGEEHASDRQIIIDQRIEALEVGDFTAGHFRPDRQAVSIGNEVDFGREATF